MTRCPRPIRATAGVVMALTIMLGVATTIAFGWTAVAGAEVRSGMAPSTTSVPTTSTASAQEKVPDTFPDQTVPKVSIPSIIPQPNSGVAPKSSTDRGGWAQYTVLTGIIVALGVMFLLIVRESRTKKRAQLAATRSSTRSEPVTDTSEN